MSGYEFLFNRIRPDPGFVSPVRSDPGFVSPVQSDPGFVSPIPSDPVRSDPAFVNGPEKMTCQDLILASHQNITIEHITFCSYSTKLIFCNPANHSSV